MKKILFFCLFIQTAAFAQKTVEEWKEVLQNAKHDTIRLKCYTFLTNFYIYDKFDSAQFYHRKGIILASKFKDKKYPFLLKSYNVFGIYHDFRGQTDSALVYYEKAEVLADEINNHEYKKTTALNIIISKYIIVSNYTGGIKALFDFNKMLDSMNNQDSNFYLNLNMELSNCYSYLNHYEKGIYYAKKMPRYCKSSVDSLLYFKTLSEAQSKDIIYFEDLKKTVSKGIKLAKKIKNSYLECSFLFELVKGYIANNQYTEALNHVNKLEEIAINGQFADHQTYAKMLYGLTYNKMKNYQKAIKYLKVSIPESKNAEDDYSVIESLLNLSEAYGGVGDYKNAYQTHLEYSKLNEEVLGKDKQNILDEINIQNLSAEKEKEIASKNLEIKLQQERTDAEHQQKNQIVFLLLITAMAAIWAFLNYRKQNRLSLALADEKSIVEKQALQLINLNKTKDRLFAIIGHDLRSPVAGLEVTLRDFTDSSGDNIQQKVNTLRSRVSGLYDTLNNLLQWARIQMHQENIEQTSLILKNEIKETLEFLNFHIEAKQINVINQINEHIIIHFNEQNLQVILRNVLSNAIKFTDEGGYIKINAETNDHNTILTIKDTGIGISEELQKNLFNNPQSRNGTKGENGTGLGLQICRDLMLASNGYFEITSKENIGTSVALGFVIKQI